MPIEYDQFFHGNSSSSIGESSSLVPHETSLQQPYHLKHVCTFEAKTLRDLIVEETSRPLDQDVNLTSPTNQPSQLVNWQRLQRMYRTNRLYIRMTKRYGEPVVLLMYPEDEHRFSFFSSDLQDVQNWSLVPPFVKSLINTQETGSDTGDYATYALLVCNNFHGWELAGCISALAPTKQQSISPAVVSFPKMKRAILPPAPHSSSSSSSMAVSTTQFYSPISDVSYLISCPLESVLVVYLFMIFLHIYRTIISINSIPRPQTLALRLTCLWTMWYLLVHSPISMEITR